MSAKSKKNAAGLGHDDVTLHKLVDLLLALRVQVLELVQRGKLDHLQPCCIKPKQDGNEDISCVAMQAHRSG